MKNVLLPILFLLVSNYGFSQKLQKEDFVEDLTYLKKTLPVKHTNLFAKISESSFNAHIDRLIAKAERLNYESFLAELFKLTVKIGDEHTFVEAKFTRTLPVKFTALKEGLFVTSIDSAHSSLLGAKLLGFNNHTITDIISSFKEIIQSENPSYFNVY
ncbi:MAG: hypothetical protein EOO20_14545, partial [Chryseobacterium sp.]